MRQVLIERRKRVRKKIQDHHSRITPGQWGVYFQPDMMESDKLDSAVFSTEAEARAWVETRLVKYLEEECPPQYRDILANSTRDRMVVYHRKPDGSLVAPDVPGGSFEAESAYGFAIQHIRSNPPPYEKWMLTAADFQNLTTDPPSAEEISTYCEAHNEVIERAIELGIETTWPDETSRLRICRLIGGELGMDMDTFGECGSCGDLAKMNLKIPCPNPEAKQRLFEDWQDSGIELFEMRMPMDKQRFLAGSLPMADDCLVFWRDGRATGVAVNPRIIPSVPITLEKAIELIETLSMPTRHQAQAICIISPGWMQIAFGDRPPTGLN
jgi:hypothetical protein